MIKHLLLRETEALSLSEVVNTIPIERLDWQIARQYELEVWVCRTDKIHEHFGGNKFFKLFYHLEQCRALQRTQLLSFGGAFSNHIYALAGVGYALNIPTIGIIRGERPKQLSPTLMDARDLGMDLQFVSREAYKNKNKPEFLDSLQKKYGDVHIIPEGGDDELGSMGCQAWGQALEKICPIKPDAVCMAVGTGGTLSGFSASAWPTQFHGYLVLKGAEGEYQMMEKKIVQRGFELMKKSGISNAHRLKPKVFLHTDAHCGGYAKQPSDLLQFIQAFEFETGVPLDPIYTGKVMFALSRQIKQNLWPKGTKLLFIHTGGIQGKRGLQH